MSIEIGAKLTDMFKRLNLSAIIFSEKIRGSASINVGKFEILALINQAQLERKLLDKREEQTINSWIEESMPKQDNTSYLG